MIAKLRETTAPDQIATAPDQIASDAAWIGSPDEIIAAITRTREALGDFEHALLQVNFNLMPLAGAQASMCFFADRVMPRFAGCQL